MNKCKECGVDFDEFPELEHPIEECPGAECTCYEVVGGHQPGCPFYRASPSRDTVAVIVATYGDKVFWDRLAERAMASVKAQTRQPEELIRYHSHGQSLSEARNTAAKMAWYCDWLVFLDADDELDPAYLEHLTRSRLDVDIWVPFVQRVRQGVVGQPGILKAPGASLYERNHIPIGAMIRRTAFEAVGGFEDWPIYEDWHFLMKLEKAGARWAVIAPAIYRIYDRKNSRNKQVHLRAPTLALIREDIVRREFATCLHPLPRSM
jgi:glycosyltransferase involved in cell wall biosynthesis